ncbi:hypothetical protein [Vulcanisaeta distributa]|uniref:Transcriptional regulator, MarR family n=1 Tax=Vulcanisaeta distributa (strain DSM 14429 / JCM 11212 / NBRC 100878 / IC-017) TaxID=572478 RepID=E1QRN6_VULDI|nr:hypothetical protein [Vulcanisaeta distributa]ADN51850.1 conserved hypothetical protein [Vulcanisaeta distributa DSM 14429]
MNLSLGEQILILIRERGPLTAEEIAYYLRRDIKEVTEELQYLEHDKLVTRVKRGLIFKKEAFDLTPTGLEEAQKAYEKLKSISERIISKINNINDEELEELLNQYVSLIPLMILLNLIPLELLMLMGLDMLLMGPVIIHGH